MRSARCPKSGGQPRAARRASSDYFALGLQDARPKAVGSKGREVSGRRAIDHREVSAPERFRDFFDRLALEQATLRPDLATVLIEAHKAELAGSAAMRTA